MKTVVSKPTVTAPQSKTVIGALLGSKIFRDYKRAFKDLTGMTITLRPLESWPLPRDASSVVNPLCALLGQKGCSCQHCRRIERRIAMKLPIRRPVTECEQCHCGAAIPLWLGRQLIGIVQMVGKAPDQRRVDQPQPKRTAGAPEIPLLTAKQHAAAIMLLNSFAKHLAIVSNQVVLQTQHIEPPLITRAKAYIEANCATDLSLGQTARALNLSIFYFCKLFKKATGVNFSEYLSRARLERAKGLLLDPNVRVSEAAFEAGFQSLTHFNRVFKNLVGTSPSEFRKQPTTG